MDTGCPRCNAALTADALECAACGLDFGLVDPAPAPSPNAERSSRVPAHAPGAPPYAPLVARIQHAATVRPARRPAEWYARLFALPVALGLSWLVATGTGMRILLRLFASMWLHEFGHATAAWMCGYPALPGPWFTPVADSRSVLLALILAAIFAGSAVIAWGTDRRSLAVVWGVLLGLQITGTAIVPPARAREIFVFAGDAGAMVWGTLAMATLYSPATSRFRRDWLRWGLLPIGAASFVDVFEQWWGARTDMDRIMFGHNEGRGPSDPSVLADTYHWSVPQLVNRYVAVGCACLVVLSLLYVVGLARARHPDP